MELQQELQYVKLQLKVEKAKSSWLDALADHLNDEETDREESKKHVDSLYEHYKKLKNNLSEFEQQISF